MKNKLLKYSFATTMLSTILMAAAPLIATFVDGLFVGNLLGGNAFNAINLFLPISSLVVIITLICTLNCQRMCFCL